LKHIDRSIGIILGVLVVISYIYYWADGAYLEKSPSAIGAFLTAIGSVVPKAIWRSEYFYQHGQPILAAQLLRVYGFCTFLLLATICCYSIYRIWAPSETGLDLIGQRLNPKDLEKTKRYEWLIWLGIALFAHLDFIGLPLDHSPRLPFQESTLGEYVIAFPIIGMSFLFCGIYYATRLRSFLRTYR
jgi:hypothetical protein